ncbi:MAG TPA: putative baseplate assembly protein [Thermoanaerobaculia bacterium]
MGVCICCGDEERRAAVRRSAHLNGLDFLEVLDEEAPEPLRQRLLVLRCLKPVAGVDRRNVRIEGGARVTGVGVVWALPLPDVAAAADPPVSAAEKAFLAAHLAAEPAPERVLVVRTDSNGDYSTYRLTLFTPPWPAAGDPPPLPDFDPRLSAVDFSFKVDCPGPFDCKPERLCPPPATSEPPIGYLAKDYGSFRRLLFDRLAAIAPDWRERNPADLGVALVELMAYAGDYLSYYQDAVATEAYLGTARRRASVRRHARMVDYFLHEGANARAWIVFESDPAADGTVLPGPLADPPAPGLRVLTASGAPGPTLPPAELAAAVEAGALVFETLFPLELHAALGEIALHAWSDRECCLPAGATRATLAGPLPVRSGPSAVAQQGGLGPGDFLLLEEVLGPETGAAADADPAHRHVVRLVEVAAAEDPLDGTPVVEVAWDAADALPFPLCLSARTDERHGARYVEGVSVARGNVVLADHGLTVAGEEIGPVPEGERPFRPRLAERSLTHAVPLPPGFLPPDPPPPAPPVLPPAADALGSDPAAALPALVLTGADGPWVPRRDLLSSGPFARELVVEMDEERRATLRFGDDRHGKRPDAGAVFVSRYRVGNGLEGNVGAGTLVQALTDAGGIRRVRNPLPAAGGAAAEPVEEARQYAPQAFRTQRRAVTEDDYARAAELHPEVSRAAATMRWTGSWRTVFVTVDRRGGRAVDADFEAALRDHLGTYRMAGYDLEVDGPRPVPVDLELFVCVEPGYRRSDVGRELLRTLGSAALPDGRRGLFHPDAWTFGQTVYLSPVVAAAAAVDGVESVRAVRFQRWGRLDEGELDDGELPVGRLEIARLDNDPSLPENGRLVLDLRGGA